MDDRTGRRQKPHTTERLLLRVEEVADLLEIGRTRVDHLIGSGELQSVKIGGSRRIPTAAVHRYLAGDDNTRPASTTTADAVTDHPPPRRRVDHASPATRD